MWQGHDVVAVVRVVALSPDRATRATASFQHSVDLILMTGCSSCCAIESPKCVPKQEFGNEVKNRSGERGVSPGENRSSGTKGQSR